MATALDPQSLARLPNVASATLPVSYERAKTALATCADVDECKDWADKAAALASYAKQSGDKSLFKMAVRIQARAIRRCGKLLHQVMPGKTGPRNSRPPAASNSRTATARKAGLSARQQKQAMRVERVPESTFESMVESEKPPSVKELATMGTMKRVAESSKRPGFSAATTAGGTLRRFAEFCQANDPVFVAGGFGVNETAEVRTDAAIVQAWIVKLMWYFTKQSRLKL